MGINMIRSGFAHSSVLLFVFFISLLMFGSLGFAVSSITVDAPNGGIIGGETDITWTAVGVTGDKVDILYNKGAGNILIQSYVPYDQMTVSWDTSTLQDGTTYKIVIADSSDYGTNDVSNNPFTIDNTAPVISVVSLNPNTGLLGIDSSVAITVTEEFFETGLLGTCTLNSKIITLTDNTDGTYTGTYTVVSGDNDATNVKATNCVLTDDVGNPSDDASSNGNTLSIDANVPNAPSVTLPSGEVTINADTYTITGVAEANSLVKIYEGTTVVGSQQLAIDATTYSISVTLTQNTDNIFTVTATDVVGNEGTSKTVPTITEDSIAPEAPSITLLDPINDANKNAVTIIGTGELNAAVSYTISDGTTTTTVATSTVDSSGNINIAEIDVTSLLDRTLTASVTLTDVAGNTGAEGTDTATKDTVAPNAPSITLPSGAITINADTYTITGVAEANSLVKIYEGTTVVGFQQLTIDATTYSISVTLTQNTDNIFTVTATDHAGNEGNPVIVPTITEDSMAPSAPSITLLDPINDANKNAVTIIGTGEPNAAVSYTISDGFTTTTPATSTIDSSGNINIVGIDVTSLLDRTLTASVTLTDVAGNTGAEGTDTATKDTVAPTFTAERTGLNTIVLEFSEVVSADIILQGMFEISEGVIVSFDATSTTTTTLTTSGITGTDETPTVTYNTGFGTLKDAAGNEIVDGTNAVATDKVSAVVTDVSSTNDNGAYKEGDTIFITVDFSESVNFYTFSSFNELIAPQMLLSTGDTNQYATYTSSSNTLILKYIVQAGDTSSDLDYFSADSLEGIIRDDALNDATLTLATPGEDGSLGYNKDIIIDTIKPTITYLLSTMGGVYKNVNVPTISATLKDVGAGLDATSIVLTFDGTIVSPTLYTYDTQTGSISYTPATNLADGTYTVTIDVKDNARNSATQASTAFDIDSTVPEITIVDDNPEYVTYLDTYTDAGATASDIHDGDLTSEIQTSGSVDTNKVGTYTITYTVSDVAGNTDTETRTVNVVNTVPVIDSMGPFSVDELVELTFTAFALDSDVPKQTLTFSLSEDAPTGATITDAGVFSWTPTELQEGTYLFWAKVSDGDKIASEEVSITVNEVNVAPVLDAIGDKSVDELVELTFAAVADDADIPAQTLTFSLVDAPTGANIDYLTGVFTWTPTESQDGTHKFTVEVTDEDDATDSEEITVTVNEVNIAPVLGAIGGALEVDEQTKLTFTAKATDADVPIQTLTFSLVNAPTGANIDYLTGVFTWTPTEAQDGIYTFTVEVTDEDDATDNEEITVTVNEVNVAPVLGAIGDKSVDELVELKFTATAMDTDVPIQDLTFTLSGDILPVDALITTGGVFTWTPTTNNIGDNLITIVVSDGTTTDSETITVTVNDKTAPVITNIIGDTMAQVGQSKEITATITDLGGISDVTLYYTIPGSSETSIAMDNVGGDTYSATIPTLSAPGTLTYYITATDVVGNTAGNPEPQEIYKIEVYDLIMGLEDGWNLLSVPKTLTDNGNVFMGTTFVFDTNENGWVSPETINPGYGYWVDSDGESLVGVNYAECGGQQQVPCSETVTLPVGWNLIGHMSDTDQPIAESLQTLSGKYAFVLSYDAATDEWDTYKDIGVKDFTNMDTGKGYWIYMKEEGSYTNI